MFVEHDTFEQEFDSDSEEDYSDYEDHADSEEYCELDYDDIYNKDHPWDILHLRRYRFAPEVWCEPYQEEDIDFFV